MSDYIDEAPPEDPYAPDTAPAVDGLALFEQGVIGGMLAHPRIIPALEREVAAGDFHDGRLGVIFTRVVEWHLAGAHIDYLSVWDQLAAWGVHGISLPELSEWGTVTADAARFYASKVREASVERALRLIGARLMEGGVEPGVAMARAAQDLRTLRDMAVGGMSVRWLREVLDVPEEDDAYDWAIPGLLERQDRLMLSAGEGVGKALDVDTPIPTPSGWTTMGALQIGDEVLGADGMPTRVTAATEHMDDRECFAVLFSDGSQIIADAEHQWLTDDYVSRQARNDRVREVRTTREILDTLRARDGFCLNHSIPAAAPLELPVADLPVEPYVLGAWLGDGHTDDGRITIGDEDADEMAALLADCGWPAHKQSGKYLYGIRGLKVKLREARVLGRKHIPTAYLRASFSQRLALLQGLMDTDGTIRAGGDERGRGKGSARCEFSVTDERLAADAYELILSLGIIATIRESDATIDGRVVGRRWRISFATDLPVFRLTRKLDRMAPLRTPRARRRYIVAVTPVESRPVRCIQVDNADHLFLAGRTMIPTHNSTFLRQMATMTAAGLHPFEGSDIPPLNVLVIDVENSERQWRRAVRGLADRAAQLGQRDPRNHLALHCVPPMDITNANDLGKVHRWIDESKPDLVLMGPLYRMTGGSLNKEEEAKPVLNALDSIRERDVAMLIEVHAGLDKDGTGERGLRPRGSSTLLGWPEFGLGIRRDKQIEGRTPTFSLVRWRGDRDRRDFPRKLVWGQSWPWERLPY